MDVNGVATQWHLSFTFLQLPFEMKLKLRKM